MSIEWEQVNPPMSLLLSWKDIPYYPRTIRDIPIAHLSVRLHDSNNVIMITDKENKDFFHCDKTRDYCKSFQIEENTATTTITIPTPPKTTGITGKELPPRRWRWRRANIITIFIIIIVI